MTQRRVDQTHERAVRAAREYADAVRDTAAFLGRRGEPPGPDDMAEYAALVAREEAAHARRHEALDALGLSVPSVESDG